MGTAASRRWESEHGKGVSPAVDDPNSTDNPRMMPGAAWTDTGGVSADQRGHSEVTQR